MAAVTPTIDSLPDLAIPSEVAQVLRCSPAYVQNRCKTGEIEATYVAGRYLITPTAVREYLERQRVKCQEETKGPAFTGALTKTSGKFDGSSMVENARNQRALASAAKLKKHSRNSSSATSGPSAQVIPLTGN